MKLYNFPTRRCFLARTAISSTGLILGGGITVSDSFAGDNPALKESRKNMDEEITAVEDLMREHGVLRRILIVYSECIRKMQGATSFNLNEPVNKAANLFRTFGENYHEALEEIYIFPAVRNIGEASDYPETLIAQHRRGREITDYIISATSDKEPADIRRLLSVMDAFVRMYRTHAAREDTVVFPVWKKTLTKEQLDNMGEKFEDIEHQRFGEDGFEKSVNQIAAIEQQLGLADLSQFTAPPLENFMIKS